MTTSDQAFLDDIERFLSSCDAPLVSVMHTLTERDENSTVSASGLSFNMKPSLPTKKRPTNRNMDTMTKLEAERAKDRRRRSIYRERRRVERETLLRQVKELSEELCRMQKNREAMAATTWKTVAKQQLEALQKAEQQQRHLQAEAQARACLISEVGGFVHEILGENNTLPENLSPNGGSCQHTRVRLGSSDTDIFETYLQGLDAVYAQTNEIFQPYTMDSLIPDLVKTQPPAALYRDGYFEFTYRHVVPFDFNITGQLLWQLAHILHRQEDRKLYDGVEDPDNTIALKFRITSCLKCGTFVSVIQRIVGRRYEESGRLVLVWRSFTEGEGLFNGMHSDETGWCIAKRLPSFEKTGTSMDLCIRHKPMHFGTAERDETIVEQFTGLVNTSGSEDIVEITTSLEKLLA